MRRSLIMGAGFRVSLFGYSMLMGVLLIGGFMACCVGYLPAMGVGQLLLAGLYLALRQGSGLPPPEEPARVERG